MEDVALAVRVKPLRKGEIKHSAKGAFSDYGDSMEDLESLVERYAKKWKLWEKNAQILVACSGGPDSIALLSILDAVSRKGESCIKVAAAHFNHEIRGREADADEEYVMTFCREHDIPCYTGRGNVPAYAKEHRISIETAAREMRYAFLYETAENIGASCIAVAHQADDQAETVLMRVLRGTGIDGLAAIRPKNGRLIRPILFASRRAIEDYCEQKGIVPCQDLTNNEETATRNRLRLSLIPQLKKESNPSLGEALCRLASIAAEQTDYIAEQARAAWNRVVCGSGDDKIVISREEFLALHNTMQMAVLREAVDRLGGQMNFSYVQYEAIQELFLPEHKGKVLHLPGGLFASSSYEKITLSKGEEQPTLWIERPLEPSGITRIDELGLSIVCEPAKPNEEVKGRMEILVDAGGFLNPRVRPRKNGDRFAVGSGSQTVKKLLIDRKIPKEKRTEIPIIESEGTILWIAGIRQADTARPINGKAALRLKLIYDKLPEWLMD